MIVDFKEKLKPNTYLFYDGKQEAQHGGTLGEWVEANIGEA
jgi:hypothetical protein